MSEDKRLLRLCCKALKLIGSCQEVNINNNHSTLAKYCKKYEKNTSKLTVGYVTISQVFKDDEEENLSKYLQRTADIYLELTPIKVRKLACQYRAALNRKFLETWVCDSMAGEQ